VDEYYIRGIQTTLSFGKWAVQTEPFRTGNFTTKFIDQHFKPEYLQSENPDAETAAALLAAAIWTQEKEEKKFALSANGGNANWKLRRR